MKVMGGRGLWREDSVENSDNDDSLTSRDIKTVLVFAKLTRQCLLELNGYILLQWQYSRSLSDKFVDRLPC